MKRPFLVVFDIHPLFAIQARVHEVDADRAIALAADKIAFHRPDWKRDIEDCILLGGVSAVAVTR